MTDEENQKKNEAKERDIRFKEDTKAKKYVNFVL